MKLDSKRVSFMSATWTTLLTLLAERRRHELVPQKGTLRLVAAEAECPARCAEAALVKIKARVERVPLNVLKRIDRAPCAWPVLQGGNSHVTPPAKQNAKSHVARPHLHTHALRGLCTAPYRLGKYGISMPKILFSIICSRCMQLFVERLAPSHARPPSSWSWISPAP